MENAGIDVVNPVSVEELAQDQLDILKKRVPHLARAAQVLAVPEWFDDQMAIRILKDVGLDGAASQTLSALKALPFVHRHEDGWAYTDFARNYFTHELLNGNGDGIEEFKALNLSAANHLALRLLHNLKSDKKRGNGRLRPDAYTNRELELRALGHWLPPKGEIAVEGMLEFYRRADKKGRTSDQRAVEAVCHKQQRWIKQNTELAYFEGRYHYERGDRRKAEPYLWYVYDRWQEFTRENYTDSEDREQMRIVKLYDELTAPAAHFLGIIVWGKHEIVDWELAETLLSDSKRLNQDLRLRRHEGEVRHTLGRLYLAWGRMREARRELDGAIDIFMKLHDRKSQGYVENTLSQLERGCLEQRSDGVRPIWGVLSARIVGRYPTDPLSVGDEYILRVRLRRSAVERMETFDVTIYAPKADINSDWIQRVQLDPNQHAVSISFPFQPLEAGSSRIELDLYHERQWLQKLRLGFEATRFEDGR